MNYGISELNYKNYILGSGWPCYKNVTVKEMTDMLPKNYPMYDTMPGRSEVVKPDNQNVNGRDVRLMKALYSKLNKTLAPFVEKVMDEYEYVGSPIYNEEGIDRETLAQLVAKVIDMAEEALDEAEEIMLETKQAGSWDKSDLLNSLVQSLLLAEIFMVRRPRYHRARNNFNYRNGEYDGINPQ
ncbi:MAG: hypothetical protein ACI4VF_06055 [Lachnospirales bacterium]